MNKFIHFTHLLMILFFFSACAHSPGTPDEPSNIEKIIYSKSSKTMELYEISFTWKKTFSNPYDPEKVEVYAYITLPGKSIVCIPGFWYEGYTRSLKGKKEILTPDGENAWKIRFTPREIGQYEYYIKIIDHDSNQTTKTPVKGNYKFFITSSNKKGFIKLSTKDKSYLEYDNGELFIGIGHNLCGWEWPGTYIDEAWNGTDNSGGTFEYDQWFNKMYDNKANLTQFDFCESDQIEWTNHPDEFPFSNEWRGLTRFNQQTAWKMDYRIKEAGKKDIFFRLTFLHWEDFDTENGISPRWGWARNPYNTVNNGPINNVSEFFKNTQAIKIFKKQVRYIIARWGYSRNLLAYELWNEIDSPNIVWGTGNFTTEVNYITAWHITIANYIKAVDINNHLVTTSFANSFNYFPVWNLPVIDMTTIHRYTYYNGFYGDAQFATVDTIHALIKDRFINTAKPVIIGEFALSPGGDIQRLKDKAGVAFHNQLWSSIISKGATTAMHWNWGSYIHNNDLYFHYKPLSSFFEGEDLRNAATFNNIGDVYSLVKYIGLKKTDAIYVWVQDRNNNFSKVSGGYVPVPISGQAITIKNVLNGKYSLSFLNTYTGKIFYTKAFEVDNGIIEIHIPDFKRDIAVKAVRI